MKIYGISYKDKIIYIGQTIQSGNKRYYDHWRESLSNHSLSAFHRFLYEHQDEKDLFKFVILEDGIDDKVLLNELEREYIEKYDTLNNGYNTYTGSNAVNLHPAGKKVIWYNNDRQYMKTFKFIVDAADFTGVNVCNVSHCCNHMQTKTSQGWFRFEDDNSPLEDSYRSGTAKRIQKLDPFTGEVLETYESMQQAEQINEITKGYLSAVCLGKKYSAKGFLYQYENMIDRQHFQGTVRDCGVAQVSKDGLVLNKFLSSKDAAEILHLNRDTITRARNYPNKVSIGYRWVRSDQYKELLEKGEIYEDGNTKIYY